MTIVLIDSETNTNKGGYDLTSELQTLEALQNTLILIYCCEIYPCYIYISFM